MKKLIIAEKPSLLRKIIEALSDSGNNFETMDYGEYSENQYYVATAQFGHLYELKDLSEYPENFDKKMWDIKNLPYFPAKYQFNVKKDCEKRIKTIEKLLARKDIDEIIHCGDPDREGQLLVDIVLMKLNNTKKVTRPILKTLTKEGILEAFNNRQGNENFKSWFNEGMIRMCSDFDYGINLSRYATIKTNSKPPLNIGRVIGAIITEIYNRDMAINNFIPEKYYSVISDVDSIKLKSKEKFSLTEKEKAENYSNSLNLTETICTKVEEKAIKKQAPKLFSQTSLQASLSKKYDYSPDETLKITQSLYEKGYISYPRTNTEYMMEDEKDVIKNILSKLQDNNLEFKDTKRVFDSSKIEGHSAIIPTGKFPINLSEKEEKCYMVILTRFKAVFTREDCIYNSITYYISNDIEEFKVTGEILKQKGYEKYEPKEIKENTLPNLIKGMVVPVAFTSVESETQPPKKYTVESFGKWLQNPFSKEEKETDDEDYKNILLGLEIGTEATRADIIKKAIDRQYISLKKKTYSIEKRGIFLVNTCKNLDIDLSKEKTALLGKITKEVYKGDKTFSQAINIIRQEVKDIFTANKNTEFDKNEANEENTVCKCPYCGKNIIETEKSYCCIGYKAGCKFTIWKNDKFFAHLEKKVNKTYIKAWASNQPAKVKNIKSKKSNTTYDAYIYLDSIDPYPKYSMEFDKK